MRYRGGSAEWRDETPGCLERGHVPRSKFALKYGYLAKYTTTPVIDKDRINLQHTEYLTRFDNRWVRWDIKYEYGFSGGSDIYGWTLHFENRDTHKRYWANEYDSPERRYPKANTNPSNFNLIEIQRLSKGPPLRTADIEFAEHSDYPRKSATKQYDIKNLIYIIPNTKIVTHLGIIHLRYTEHARQISYILHSGCMR